MHAHGNEVAAVWREIAESYRFLEECQDREDGQKGALLSERLRPGLLPPAFVF